MLTNPKSYVAIDLGAESGRVILGHLHGPSLSHQEIHRFSNGPIDIEGTLRWDADRLWQEIQLGLKQVAQQDKPIASISVDAWGVDYVLLDEAGQQVAQPFNHRDARTDQVFPESTSSSENRELIFEESGIQFMPINSLYQLIAENLTNPDQLKSATAFLTIADYYNYLLSGVESIEESLASTTQLLNPHTKQWSKKLIAKFSLPPHIFPNVCSSGTVLGPLLPSIRSQTGLGDAQVIASCSHDTGAAVAAVPTAGGNDWAYLSSGTWSLLGVELESPLVTKDARIQNYTNESGFAGTTRFLKNIIGLWLLQEARRQWNHAGHSFDYQQLGELAEQAQPLRSIINPNSSRFLKPDNMLGKIEQFCLDTGQPPPNSPGEFTRCILESLALSYRQHLDNIQQLTNRSIKTLHIVGGGSNSDLLNQYSANATGRTVIAGPVEATAIGNLLIQAIALGDIASLDDLRQIVRQSYPIKTFVPQLSDAWKNASTKFLSLESIS